MLATQSSYDQTALIAALRQPHCYPHPVTTVTHLQTHISHILLAGDYAYKIKKPVCLGFLDFTSLSQRKYYCEEELRLNRRLAPQLYIDCIPIGGEPHQPLLGGDSPAFEYAVRMHRFEQDTLLDRQFAANRLHSHHMTTLAQQLAEFHHQIPVADSTVLFGEPEQVRQPIYQNFSLTRPLLNDPADLDTLNAVERWVTDTFTHLHPKLLERKAHGRIRECHGDLHLGNMFLTQNNHVTIFDCIEFNDNLRWIDVFSDLAFLTMDLRFRGAESFAQQVLNTYLEFSGDFEGLPLLAWYQVYRAMVRVKVNAIQASQREIPEVDRVLAHRQYRTYLQLAWRLTQSATPFLLITHGLSGSGKSRRTGQLLEILPDTIRIRADIERKRLFNLKPLDNSRSALGQGIYTPDAHRRTYQRLLELADQLLTDGYPVLVDATFLKKAHRQPFRALAQRHGIPFVLLQCSADPKILRERVTRRKEQGNDAAEADVAVLERQLRSAEPPTPDECPLMSGNDGDLERLRAAILATHA